MMKLRPHRAQVSQTAGKYLPVDTAQEGKQLASWWFVIRPIEARDQRSLGWMMGMNRQTEKNDDEVICGGGTLLWSTTANDSEILHLIIEDQTAGALAGPSNLHSQLSMQSPLYLVSSGFGSPPLDVFSKSMSNVIRSNVPILAYDTQPGGGSRRRRDDLQLMCEARKERKVFLERHTSMERSMT